MGQWTFACWKVTSKSPCSLTDNDLVQIFNKKQYKPVKSFHQHPDYTGLLEIKNDVGLVELAEPLEFSETVQPACLDFEAREIYDGPLTVRA